MAVECFRVGDRLWVNELAPRVHNTGHWTQAGCAVSQFELHLRALFGLPLPEPHLKGITAMVNLVGVERDDRWLALPQAELFWYGKAVRPGRKVGHLNFCLAPGAPSPFPALRPLLPERYAATLDWLEAALALP
ncbi:MAG: hypothetical protein KatS3mg124_2051 [Porticoccaceae bacterium]|nr:MAG: hypothetical protein KatS3mg124_2051 [Porticoccaceae bacterium]